MREYPGALSHWLGATFEQALDRLLERLFFLRRLPSKAELS